MYRYKPKKDKNKMPNTKTLTVTVESKSIADAAKKVEKYARKLRLSLEDLDQIAAKISFETK